SSRGAGDSVRTRARARPSGEGCARSGRGRGAARALGYRRASSPLDVALLDAPADVVTEIGAPDRGPGLLAHHRVVSLLLLVLGRGTRGLLTVGLGPNDGPRRLRFALDLERHRALAPPRL